MHTINPLHLLIFLLLAIVVPPFPVPAQQYNIQLITRSDDRFQPYELVNLSDTEFIRFTFSSGDMGLKHISGFQLRDSIPDGQYQVFLDGRLARAGSILGGVRHGVWKAWYYGAGSSSLVSWTEEHGRRQGYHCTYTDGKLSYYIYYRNDTPLFSESLHHGRAYARSVLANSMGASFDEEGRIVRVNTFLPLSEEHSRAADTETIQYLQLQPGRELVVTTVAGRAVHWKYREYASQLTISVARPDTVMPADASPGNGNTPPDAAFICRLAETPPAFPGGNNAMRQFFQKHIRYPASLRRMGTEGRVFLSLTVDEKGRIADVAVRRTFHPDASREAIRVVRLFPRLVPGSVSGRPVRATLVVPVDFKLAD